MNPDPEHMKRIAPLGAAVSARAQRIKALQAYAQTDPHCLHCGVSIEPKKPGGGTWARSSRRKFCSHKCVALYKWKTFRDQNNLPEPVRHEPAITKTPFKMKWEVNPKMINKHARKVYDAAVPEPFCEECGEKTRELIDVCHIKAISEFEQDALLVEINARQNLKGLCKNCHWTFDLRLAGRKGNKKAPKVSLGGS